MLNRKLNRKSQILARSTGGANRKSKRGFTLIELVVVMAIIAVLAVLIIAAIQAARRASVVTQNKGNAKTVEVAMEAYASKLNGQYPTSMNNVTLANAKSNVDLAPYLSSAITGSCANAGGTVVVPSASTFSITVYDYDCTTALTNFVIQH